MLHVQIISNACTCTLENERVMPRFLSIAVPSVIRYICTNIYLIKCTGYASNLSFYRAYIYNYGMHINILQKLTTP